MTLAVGLIFFALFIYLAIKKPGPAVILCLPTAVISAIAILIALEMGIFADGINEVMTLCLVTAIFPATLLTVCVNGKCNFEKQQKWPYKFSVWAIRAFNYLIGLAILLFIFNFFGLLIWLLLMTFIYRFHMASRHSAVMDVISTVGASIRQNLPLPMALESAVDDKKGSRKLLFKRISNWLIEGYPLSEAIKRGYPKCPAYITSTIAAAEPIGQLPQAILSLEKQILIASDEMKRVRPVHPNYPMIVITVAFLVMLGLSIFILPTFSEVIEDMSDGTVEINKSTQLLLDLSRSLMARDGLYAILLVLAVVTVNLIMPMIVNFYRCRPRRVDKPHLITRIGDFVKWHLPIVRWFEMNYCLVRMTGFLRVALISGSTVDDAVSRAGKLDLNVCFKKRLYKWLEKIKAGENISKAALACKMPKSIGWAFSTTNTPEILEMLENFYRTNYNYKANVARSIFWPSVIVVIGFGVGFICYAMFVPMIDIITVLTESIYPS